jgi:hypothetical protein
LGETQSLTAVHACKHIPLPGLQMKGAQSVMPASPGTLAFCEV